MKLSGKCKEDFEQWYRGQKEPEGYWYSIVNFNGLVDSMKYGVYVDFFDSVGIYTSIEPLYDMQGTNRVCIYSLKLENNFYLQCKNRCIAREKSIEKANEIYNEKN